MKPEWTQLCEKINYQFEDVSLLKQALTHKSHVVDESGEATGNNERLEFLGDAVLDMVISELLMQQFTDLEEGGLSKFRASLVSETGLSKQARSLELGACLLLGRGEEMTGGRQKSSLLADAFEAVLAAVYLDSREKHGISKISQVIEKLFKPHLPKSADSFITRDYKSELQEYVQKILGMPSTYQLVEQSGPDHQKEFIMAVNVKQIECGTGKGFSKKQASQLAAKDALEKIEKNPDFIQNRINS